jgi:uncharacterized RDD family membrane protein YckC
MAYGSGPLFCAECGRPSAPDELARFGELLICSDCKTRYAQKLREGVETAPAVRYGGFWIRVVAVLIDGIILFTINSILNFALRGILIPVAPPIRPGAPLSEVWLTASTAFIRATLINTIINCIYEVTFLAKMGATPGKAAFGLKVVRPDGRPIGAGRALGRFFAKLGEGWIILIGWCGYLLAGIDSQKRALHDMICDTRVIRTR